MNFLAAGLYAVSTAVLVALGMAWAAGGLNPTLAGVALAVGSWVAAFSIWQQRHAASNHSRRALNAGEWAAIVAFSLFGLRAFLWLAFLAGNSIRILSPNNLGDLSLHLTYLRFFADGAPFWPDNPILTGQPLTYPLGLDLFNSLLSLLGVDDLRGLIWVGLAGCAGTGLALWRWGGAFALTGFLCNGGVAGWAFFRTGKWADYQAELAWKSLPLALLVTQRGLLFALPAGLLLLSSWRTRFFSDDPSRWRLPRWGEILLYASLPIFHFHTFLFLSVVLAVWFVCERKTRSSIGALIAWAFLPASALVFLITGGFRGASMLGWLPGWMQGSQNFFAFWLENFGILPFLVAALIVQLWRRKTHPGARSLVGAALGVFLVCCFVKFAPWEWDNTKLMIWSYLVVLPFLWSQVIAPLPCVARALCCVALFSSGFVSTFGGIDATHTGYELANRAELDQLDAVLRRIPITERFIGWSTYNHPLLLSGRKMAIGYTGHTKSHGLDWEETARQVDLLLRGEPGWHERAADLHVRYLFWGRLERENIRDSSEPWRDQSRLVAEGPWGEIYDLTHPPAELAPK